MQAVIHLAMPKMSVVEEQESQSNLQTNLVYLPILDPFLPKIYV